MSDVDVAIVGAGVHGAGVAQAAAAAGHSVLLLEQTAVAAGTSSRSSKLIHGGLRYLETAQLHLVRESLHERTLLLRLAPQLVRLQRFYLPLYERTRRRAWQLRVGLSLYGALAAFGGAGASAAFGTLDAREWPRLDGLELAGLRTVFWYYDAQTDDRALTRAIVQSARGLGATLLCPARVLGAQLEDHGVRLRYQGPQREEQCRARVLVNAAGPWAEALARSVTPTVAVPPLQYVQGSHLLLPVRIERGIYYVESPRDGRAVFVMPWHEQLLLGTTETRFRGDPARAAPTAAEQHYLLGVLKHYFPRLRSLGIHDVSGSFAGIRMLPRAPGHAFHRPREAMLVCDRRERPRVLSIYGGKLTTWRATAQLAMRRIAASLPRRPPVARTDQLPLVPVAADERSSGTDPARAGDS